MEASRASCRGETASPASSPASVPAAGALPSRRASSRSWGWSGSWSGSSSPSSVSAPHPRAPRSSRSGLGVGGGPSVGPGEPGRCLFSDAIADAGRSSGDTAATADVAR
uniref:Uncharacterized protein n=1 Tax=Human herpesvirus 1 TaxID=10298 RepID=A0A2Z4H1N0_HHV1|nr:hypothetical protein [Human alphaherpesvirus 1]